MPFTPEEIEAIKPLLESDNLEHEALNPLKELGLIIRTPKGEESFRTNYLNTEFSKRDASAYVNVEKQIFEITGIEKNANEKASEYVQRALNADKEARSTLATELEKLKEEKKAGFGNADANKRIEQLENLLRTEKENYTQELSKKEQEKLDIRVEGQTEAALAGIRANIRKSIDASILDDVIDARLSKFRRTFTPKLNDKGVIVYVDDKGDIVNNTTTFKPLTTTEIVADFFKDLIEEKKEQGGSGSGKSKNEQRKDGEPVPAPPAEIKTQVQLTTYLKEHGLVTGTKEFNENFAKYKGNLPLR